MWPFNGVCGPQHLVDDAVSLRLWREKLLTMKLHWDSDWSECLALNTCFYVVIDDKLTWIFFQHQDILG